MRYSFFFVVGALIVAQCNCSGRPPLNQFDTILIKDGIIYDDSTKIGEVVSNGDFILDDKITLDSIINLVHNAGLIKGRTHNISFEKSETYDNNQYRILYDSIVVTENDTWACIVSEFILLNLDTAYTILEYSFFSINQAHLKYYRFWSYENSSRSRDMNFWEELIISKGL